MKFAQGRTKENPAQQPPVQASVASTALQHSQLLQQQSQQIAAIQQSPQQLLQRKQLQGLVSQQLSLDEAEPLQGKFAVLQQAVLEEEEPLQGKFDAAKQLQLDEEEPLQGKFEPDAVSQRQADTSSNNTGMPEQLKTGIENLSGYAMDDVKVHYNSAKPAQMQAHAYAQGTDIHLAPGQEQHLPHEAWHVVQQKQGRVRATTQLKGEAINDDPGLEHEADVMGAKAQAVVARKNEIGGRASPLSQVDTIQRLVVPDDHVRGDLRHDKVNKLFENHTIADIQGRLGAAISSSSNIAVDGAVNASRAAAMMDYAVLSQQKVTSEKQLTSYLDNREEDEHMYVLSNSDELHVAIRSDGQKLPHPTLVGGDPDVKCAGTLRYGSSEKSDVVVTASSGHFRPTSSATAQKVVNKIMEKTASQSRKKKTSRTKY
ncbi:eCIS core domain-containing protein [Arsukibacterium ikkense]|uniref:eCIS core domain-containing protein n=1 Tax=Arsukibacterium ikkense TaxID=336831 RepID=UPI000A05334B|nr:DUF4157 domain-containing protein [Arsukibacterium ikkense]